MKEKYEKLKEDITILWFPEKFNIPSNITTDRESAFTTNMEKKNISSSKIRH